MFQVFQHRAQATMFLEASMDALLGFVAVLLAFATVNVLQDDHRAVFFYQANVLGAAFGFAICVALFQSFLGLYRVRKAPMLKQFGRLLIAVSVGGYMTYLGIKEAGFDGRPAQLIGYAVLYLVLSLLMVRGAIAALHGSREGKRVLIVGSGPEAQAIAQQLDSRSSMRSNVVGFYPTRHSSEQSFIGSTPVLDARMPLHRLARDMGVAEIIVAAHEQRGAGIPMNDLVLCRSMGMPVVDVAAFYERTHGEVQLESLKASWLVYGSGFVQGAVRRLLKRSFDIVVSTLLLILAAPVMVIAALAIKLDSKGPLIYKQERVGLRGKSFMCLKFRSMRTDAERDGVAVWASKNDSRVTRVGKFMRGTRIDELPQLISVLRGEMSMVGPRPERPSFVNQLREQMPFYDLRHTVKPGVTGWAQVRFSYGETVEDARRKHQFDLYYVKNNSLLLDIQIIIETVSVVLFREGQ